MTDALSEVLARVDLEGAVLSRAELGAPWAVSATAMPTAVVHAVVQGCAYLTPDGGAPVRLDAGDVALLVRGSAHVLADTEGRPAQPLASLPRRVEGQVKVVHGGGKGVRTSILCGVVRFPERGPHHLFDPLPDAVVARRGSDAEGRFVESALALLLDELHQGAPGSSAVVARLVEVLVVRVLQRGLAQQPIAAGSWLAGLHDPIVGRALAMIHGTDAPTPVDELARQIGVSRSVLFDRFRTLVGESPSRYAVRWRVHRAACALSEERVSVAEAATRAGYRSEASFAKAFKRLVGIPPGEYRMQRDDDDTVRREPTAFRSAPTSLPPV